MPSLISLKNQQIKGPKPKVSKPKKPAAQKFQPLKTAPVKATQATSRYSFRQAIPIINAGHPIPKLQRPNFSSAKKNASRLEATIATGKDFSKIDLNQEDLAAPHRAPYARLEKSILTEPKSTVAKRINSLISGSKSYESTFATTSSNTDVARLNNLYKKTRKDLESALTRYQNAQNPKHVRLARLRLLAAANNLASNAPGLGPHSDVNIIASDRLHLRVYEGELTPRSKAAHEAFFGDPVAANPADELISPSGGAHPLNKKHAGMTLESIDIGNTISESVLTASQNKLLRPVNSTLMMDGPNSSQIK